jgi:hypothetical protein
LVAFFLPGHLHAARTLAGTGVGLGALAADREAAPVAQAAVGADLLQPLDVLGTVAAEVALDGVVVDLLAQLDDLVVGEVADAAVGIHAGLVQDPVRGRAADAVDVGQADLGALVQGDVDAGDTRHAATPDAACAAGSSRSPAPHRCGG